MDAAFYLTIVSTYVRQCADLRLLTSQGIGEDKKRQRSEGGLT